jgi:hypothetical protein
VDGCQPLVPWRDHELGLVLAAPDRQAAQGEVTRRWLTTLL